MLPYDIRGNWIWAPTEPAAVEDYCLFRREFMLSETPGSAELWITAGTFFHLYLNGRHLGFGPCPTPAGQLSVLYLDASYFLQTGKNVFAVLAHNTQVARSSCTRHPNGFWCQLNIEDRPTIWTDGSWKARPATFFQNERPRRSPASTFTEKIDLRLYPIDWKDEIIEHKGWFPPQQSTPMNQSRLQLTPSRLPEFSSHHKPFRHVHSAGTAEPDKTAAYLTFNHLTETRGPGVYLAETFMYADKDKNLNFYLGNDNPYRLFVNQQLIKAQGSASLIPGADRMRCTPPCFAEGDQDDPQGDLPLKEGWNHIMLYQQTEPGCAGAILSIPELPNNPSTFRRSPEDYGVPGWSLIGPLQTPLGHTTGTQLPQEFTREAYSPERCATEDEGVITAAYTFTPSPDAHKKPECFKIREGGYVILDFENTTFGCPEFKISGISGDIVHVICGERILDNRVIPSGNPLLNIDTIICGEGEYQWLGCRPLPVRYIMIHVPRASSTVTFSTPGIRTRDFTYGKIGDFQCNDEQLNQIWKTSRYTLAATMQGIFLDDPGGDNAQYIADTMLQSWAACHIFGAYDLTAYSLEDFANVQFETGEMCAITPSDLYSHIPDYSLMWPIWLQRHYLYTGDQRLAERLLPAMKRLFSFFEAIAEPQTGLLTDMEEDWNATCFLDHGDIDRNGIITGLNAIYCRSLFSGARLLEDLDEPEEAEHLRQRATLLAQRLRQLTLDPETGLFADSWHNGAQSPHSSWQTNLLAIYGGIVDPEMSEQLFNNLFEQTEPYEPVNNDGPACNAYFRHFIIESALALEKHTWAMNMIKTYWGGMVDNGAKTWWEFYDPNGPIPPIEGSLCNGTAAFPAAYLCTELAGIRPVKPGFAAVVFCPALDTTNWAKAQIPTFHGHICVEWSLSDDNQLDVVIDSTFPLEVIPIIPGDIAANATFHVSDDITILADTAED